MPFPFSSPYPSARLARRARQALADVGITSEAERTSADPELVASVEAPFRDGLTDEQPA